MRTALLTATALSILAAGAAWADGGNGKRLTGLGEFGYEYTDVEYDNGFGYYANSFHGAGSALWTWPGNLNLQGNFAFNADRFVYDGGEEGNTDTWKAGVTGFWRDAKQGAVGGEIHYQSATWGNYADGIDIAARGEFYLPQATLGGRVGYSKFTGNNTNIGIDGWYVGAEGKYYASPNIGLKLGAAFGWNDQEPSGTADSWSLDGELEYLIPDCTTSVFAGIGYETWEFEGIGSSETDGWRAGLGMRVHFGTEGGLLQRNRAEPLEMNRIRVNF
jgi:hypothetical protein